MSENGEPEVEEQPQPENGWININNEYLLPRSFLENCVVYIQRSGSTLVIRTVEDQSDLTIVLPDVQSAIKTLMDITESFNRQTIQCNIDFGTSILETAS